MKVEQRRWWRTGRITKYIHIGQSLLYIHIRNLWPKYVEYFPQSFIVVIVPVVVPGHLFGVTDVRLGEIVPLLVEGLEVARRLERVPEPLGVDHRGLHLLLGEAGLHLRSRGISRIFVVVVGGTGNWGKIYKKYRESPNFGRS